MPRRCQRTVRRRESGRDSGADGLFDALATTDGGGGSSFSPSSSIFINVTQQSTSFYRRNRQIRKVNLIIKINLILFISISTSNAYRSELYFTASVITAPTEIRAMVNTRSDWCSLFEQFLTKCDNILAHFPPLGSRHTNKNSRFCAYK